MTTVIVITMLMTITTKTTSAEYVGNYPRDDHACNHIRRGYSGNHTRRDYSGNHTRRDYVYIHIRRGCAKTQCDYVANTQGVSIQTITQGVVMIATILYGVCLQVYEA